MTHFQACLFPTDHPLPAVRKVGGLVGFRGPALRDAGRPATVRWRGRGGAVRSHHRPQRVLPQVAVERVQGNLQRTSHQKPGMAFICGHRPKTQEFLIVGRSEGEKVSVRLTSLS